jgi:hypothetical protein
LITLEELHERLRESEEDVRPVSTIPGQLDLMVNLGYGKIVPISAEDYALGVSDLTGELMRYATNCECHRSGAMALTERRTV